MSVVQQAVLLLLVAIGANAHHSPGDCEDFSKTLIKADISKTVGHWALVWSVAQLQTTDLLTNLSSSHVVIKLLPDNHTIVFHETNMFHDKSCTEYTINMTIPSDPSDAHSLHIESASFEKNGVQTPYNNSGTVDFYESCADCLTMVYRGSDGHYLLGYRKEGHHQDAEKLKEAQTHHENMAACLGFAHDKPFVYDGAAGFCQKDVAEATVEES